MTKKQKPKFYECGICDGFHPANWDGDCRDDKNRFSLSDLDVLYGSLGWEEVPMPETGEANPSKFVPKQLKKHI